MSTAPEAAPSSGDRQRAPVPPPPAAAAGGPGTPPASSGQEDASRGEVILYAVGNIQATIGQQVLPALQQIMVVSMLVNPLLIGLVVGIATLWGGIVDPIMAYITDNARTRWGRRRPFILVGGIAQMLILFVAMLLFPRSDTYLSNRYMETDRRLKEAGAAVKNAQAVFAEAYRQVTGTLPATAAAIDPKTLRHSVAQSLDKLATARAELPGLLDLLHTSIEEKTRLAATAESEAGTDSPLATRRRQVVVATRDLIAQAKKNLDRAATLPPLGTATLALIDGTGPLAAARQQECAALLATIAADDQAAKTARAVALGQPQTGFFKKMADGVRMLGDPTNADQRRIILFVLVFWILFNTCGSMIGIAYYALGIELSPSYDGRTQVAVYRAITTKLTGLIGPWIPFFCYLLWFNSARDGLAWFAGLGGAIGIACVILMVLKTKERARVSASKTGKLKMGFWKSVWVTVQSSYFWRIFLLYKSIGLSWGVFMQFGTYINIYWVMGSAIAGARLSGILQTMAWATTFAALPLVNWGCRRFQKHNVIQVAMILMSIGAVLQWWTVNPRYPYLQLIMPFFTSVGIASFYVVMGTLMADVTDADELKTGERREGMYAAVMSFISKLTDAFTPVLAGLMLVVSGFDPALEFSQSEQTILNMRLLYTFVPGALMFISLLLLWRYPLTRTKMEEIKAILKQRHDAEDAAAQHA